MTLTFMKYHSSIFSLKFPPINLIWKTHVFGITFAKFCTASGKWVYEGYLQKSLPIFPFLSKAYN